jgi:hypothetical protein
MPMKICLAAKPVNRTTARNSFLINQLATPGLGSLLAGRYLTGAGQLLLAVSGFILVVVWFVLMAIQMYQQIDGQTRQGSFGWVGELGALIFAAAWLWSLTTSLSLLRQARTTEAALS